MLPLLPSRLLVRDAAAYLLVIAVFSGPTQLVAQGHDTTTTKRVCKPLERPKKLPPLPQVIDSADLVMNLASWSPLTGQEIIFSIARPRSNERATVRLFSPALAPDSAQRLTEVVRSALHPTTSLDIPSVRLHIRIAAQPEAWLARSVLCGPVPIEPPPGTLTFSIQSTSGDVPEALRRQMQNWHPTFSILVGIDGRVVDARAQPSSGLPDVDSAAETSFVEVHHRYLPALLDGIPVEVWITRNRLELAR